MNTDSLVFQEFRSQDSEPLASVLTHISEETGDRYILWSEIQLAFKGIDSLSDVWGQRIMFAVDGDNMYVCL